MSRDLPVHAARFPSGIALAVARVTAAEAQDGALAAAWLGGEERSRLARFLVPHARADFLAGRVAAKSAVGTLVPDGPAASAWEILSAASQPPRLPFPEVGVSIAHTRGLGLALAHPAGTRCGCDLEPADRDAVEAVASQVTEAEMAWAGEAPARALALWTAREALGKSLGTGLGESARLLPTGGWEDAPHGWRALFPGNEGARARTVCAAGFVATLVLPPEGEAEAMAVWLATALTRVESPAH